MAISQYIKDIGRGHEGARSITRAQAADLMGQILDGSVPDTAVGAFCAAMRIKGETLEELTGFIEATEARLPPCPAAPPATVVIPSYNGARRLPVLTPLLALLLAREGLAVRVHGCATEDQRVSAASVWQALGHGLVPPQAAAVAGEVSWVDTASMHAGLHRLLEARRAIGLRNSAHSVVKLINPIGRADAILVSSFTHPEYALTMANTLTSMRRHALLLHGTEGEAVADARRTPAMQRVTEGAVQEVQAAQSGPLASLPDWPATTDASDCARYTDDVLNGRKPVPPSIALQVGHVVDLAQAVRRQGHDQAAAVPARAGEQHA